MKKILALVANRDFLDAVYTAGENCELVLPPCIETAVIPHVQREKFDLVIIAGGNPAWVERIYKSLLTYIGQTPVFVATLEPSWFGETVRDFPNVKFFSAGRPPTEENWISLDQLGKKAREVLAATTIHYKKPTRRHLEPQ